MSKPIGARNKPQNYPTIKEAVAAAADNHTLVWATVGGDASVLYHILPSGEVRQWHQ